MTGFAVTVELLTGRYVATSHYDRNRHEWPPHPARLFSALVHAHHDTDEPDPEERAALQWFEALPPPSISADIDPTPRPAVTVYVPNNDSQVMGLRITVDLYEKVIQARERMAAAPSDAKRASGRRAVERAREVSTQVSRVGKTPVANALDLLPAGRGKQARTFPSVTPRPASVTYRWDGINLPEDRLPALEHLLARTTRLGHSSTLVWCRLDDEPPPATLVPDVEGDKEVRTIGRGQLEALERRFSVHRGQSPRSLPTAMTRYRVMGGREPALTAPEPVSAGEWFVFGHEDGRHLGSWATSSLARAVRGALMSSLGKDIPALLSGHAEDGRAVEAPHLAVLPLPFVGHRHADGLVLGFALQLPRESPLLEGRDRVLEAIARWEASDSTGEDRAKIHLDGGAVSWYRRVRDPGLWTLQSRRWARPATTWVTATPIALDRHPGDLHRGSSERVARNTAAAASTIADACRHVGLPEPMHVDVSLQPLLAGTRPARRYLPFAHGKSGVRRLLVHASVTFDQPVRGPLVLGAGRYFGLGLMAPMPQG